MNRTGRFSYACNQCGLCCREQVITLSPHDVLRIARAARIRTDEALRAYTLRRGSLLRFTDAGSCAALDGARCTIHRGRPLACRLYPLGLQRDARGAETFVRLEPAAGSRGVSGDDGTLAEFLDAQGVDDYLRAIADYRRLLRVIRARIAALVDFDTVEPREFWRIAVREALAEREFEPNPIIDALFDADGAGGPRDSIRESVTTHTRALEALIRATTAPRMLATAAVLLAVSLGYPPAEAGAP